MSRSTARRRPRRSSRALHERSAVTVAASSREHTRAPTRLGTGRREDTHRLTWRGQFRPLDEWVAQAPTLLKEEAARACQSLAESLVDEVFLLHLPADER